MSMSGDGFDLERLLEQELQRGAGRLSGPNPLPAQSAYHAAATTGGALLSSSSFVTALLSSKLAIAAAAATVVVGGAAVTATAATGSPDPTVWGQRVVQVVQGCQTSIGTGPTALNHTASGPRDNIGQCVSAFAKTHGATERALHSHASSARTNHPTGKPSNAPGRPENPGKPSNVPVGPPSGVTPNGPPTGRPTPPHGKP